MAFVGATFGSAAIFDDRQCGTQHSAATALPGKKGPEPQPLTVQAVCDNFHCSTPHSADTSLQTGRRLLRLCSGAAVE